MWCFPKIGVSPVITHFSGILPNKNPPAIGVSPISGNPHVIPNTRCNQHGHTNTSPVAQPISSELPATFSRPQLESFPVVPLCWVSKFTYCVYIDLDWYIVYLCYDYYVYIYIWYLHIYIYIHMCVCAVNRHMSIYIYIYKFIWVSLAWVSKFPPCWEILDGSAASKTSAELVA